MDYKENLIHAINSMTIDTNETVVKNWYKAHGLDINTPVSTLPQFHLETGIKKWGQIQREVLKEI